MSFRRALSLVVGLLLPLCLGAQPPDRLPAPQGYIADFAHIVEPATAAEIVSACGTVERDTGVRLLVVTVADSSPRTPGQLAQVLLQQWKRPGGPPAVVLLISAKAGRLGVGRDDVLDPVLTNAALQQIVPPNVRRMNTDFQGGLAQLVLDMSREIARGKGKTVAIPSTTQVHGSSPVSPIESALGRILAIPVWLPSRFYNGHTIPLGGIALIAVLLVIYATIRSRFAGLVLGIVLAVYICAGAMIASLAAGDMRLSERLAIALAILLSIAYAGWRGVGMPLRLPRRPAAENAMASSAAAAAEQGPIIREKPGLFS